MYIWAELGMNPGPLSPHNSAQTTKPWLLWLCKHQLLSISEWLQLFSNSWNLSLRSPTDDVAKKCPTNLYRGARIRTLVTSGSTGRVAPDWDLRRMVHPPSYSAASSHSSLIHSNLNGAWFTLNWSSILLNCKAAAALALMQSLRRWNKCNACPVCNKFQSRHNLFSNPVFFIFHWIATA